MNPRWQLNRHTYLCHTLYDNRALTNGRLEAGASHVCHIMYDKRRWAVMGRNG
jgi:hypothetical protein